MKKQIKKIHIFYRDDNKKALVWKDKIATRIKNSQKRMIFDSQKPEVVVVLGGDGTILEASRIFKKNNPILIGLNLGHVGFLASVRSPSKFLKSLDNFFAGKYDLAEKMMLKASVVRKDKVVFRCESLNEISVQNPLGMVNLQVHVGDHPVQSVFGTGVMVATSTGSTAYNISAHGPIVMPDVKSFIITEIMDHDIPTPSVVIDHQHVISVKVSDFRARGLLSISSTGQKFDVVLVGDGETIFPLQKSDVVKVEKSSNLIRFAELEKNYFFKSISEKFGLK